MSRPPAFAVLPREETRRLERDRSGRFDFRVPARWRAPVRKNRHADAAAAEVLRWFAALGCDEAELARARAFDVAGYVGLPLPTIPRAKTVSMAKYLALWLLWDDVHVESLEHGWRIDAGDVLAGRRPHDATRFDEGWWQLLRELSGRRSERWIRRLCDGMAAWDAAAVDETLLRGLPFERQLELRVATIGMYPTLALLEDVRDAELPAALHDDPLAARIAYLANLVVGLGNDLLSFGKDHAEGRPNLVATLMEERGLAGGDALRELLRMHEDALLEVDRLAPLLEERLPDARVHVARWLQDVRHASIGFSLWEAGAPRYTAYALVVDGAVVEPRFVFTRDLAAARAREASPRLGLRPALA